MTKGFYAKLAGQNLFKNKKIYIPFIITSTITSMMLYMIIALSDNPTMNQMVGGKEMAMMLGLGVVVVELFAIIFLFYTNSFLLKRRKQEFGLYSVLGMEKKHLARVMLYELLYCLLLSLAIGLALGMLLDKLFYLLIIKMLGTEVPLGFYVSEKGLVETSCYIGGVYLLMFIYSTFQIQISKPIELLHASQMAEKEPKVKWILTVVGFLFLAAGYGISLYITNPIEAMLLFFVAVICVIIGTYLLFTAGSIALLKLLEKNKRYYYKPNHFLSVSNMKFRMKQNAVSLGNICILSTMVLVMLSTTITMWVGLIDLVNDNMGYDYEIFTSFDDLSQLPMIEEGIEEYKTIAQIDPSEVADFISFETSLKREGDAFTTEMGTTNQVFLDFVDLKDYDRITGRSIELASNEVLVYGIKVPYDGSTMDILGDSFQIKEKLEDFPLKSNAETYVNDVYYVVVPNRETLIALKEQIEGTYQAGGVEYTPSWQYHYNYDGPEVDSGTLSSALKEAMHGKPVNFSYIRSRADMLFDIRSLYAGFLFIGIFLSILFIMATILIMYYKQISEGYEDMKRFEIMKKVGLDEKQIKQTIRSQVLIMFFLPLIVAMIHVCFAFPIIRRLLLLVSISNTQLFIFTMIACFVAFSLAYILIYFFTAKEYYSIVSNKE